MHFTFLCDAAQLHTCICSLWMRSTAKHSKRIGSPDSGMIWWQKVLKYSMCVCVCVYHRILTSIGCLGVFVSHACNDTRPANLLQTAAPFISCLLSILSTMYNKIKWANSDAHHLLWMNECRALIIAHICKYPLFALCSPARRAIEYNRSRIFGE